MQGSKSQMPGFRDVQGRIHRLQIPHLSDHDHIRILPQSIFKSTGKGRGVGVDFSLVDERGIMSMEILDRILNRQDVTMPFLVDLVDQSCQGSGFSAAGGTGHQDQTARQICLLHHRLGNAQLLETRYSERNLPQGHGHVAPLHEDVASESAQLFDAEGEVQLALLLKSLSLFFAHYAVS